MATKSKGGTALAEPQKKTSTKPVRFQAPDELDEKFGVDTNDERDLCGIVSTENIQALLDAFGVPRREHISLPFQHMERQGSDVARLRIDPLGTHSTDDGLVNGHRWVYVKRLKDEHA